MRHGKEAQNAEPLSGRIPSTEDFIYFAGLFDGEGSFDLSTGRIRTPRFKISMTDGPTVDWLYHTFGGNVVRDNPSGSGKLQAWKWYAIRQADVRALLEGVTPHLKLKRRRAEAALRVLDYLQVAHKSSYRNDAWLDGLYELTEQCFARSWPQRMSELAD